MKKIFAVILVAMFGFGIVGCGSSKSSSEYEDSRFEIIESTPSWDVVADKETKVMYAVSNNGRTNGTFTLLVDADGSPLLYEEDI